MGSMLDCGLIGPSVNPVAKVTALYSWPRYFTPTVFLSMGKWHHQNGHCQNPSSSREVYSQLFHVIQGSYSAYYRCSTFKFHDFFHDFFKFSMTFQDQQLNSMSFQTWKWNSSIPWLSKFSMTCTNPVIKIDQSSVPLGRFKDCHQAYILYLKGKLVAHQQLHIINFKLFLL